MAFIKGKNDSHIEMCWGGIHLNHSQGKERPRFAVVAKDECFK